MNRWRKNLVERVFVKSGEKFETVDLISFEKEKPLEQTIINNPKLIPLDIIVSIPEIEFFPISSQVHTNHGNLDIIGVDSLGGIYILETKLYSNSDFRCVTAQVLDYAGALKAISHDFEDFKERIKKANQYDVNKKTRLENKTLEELVSEIPNSEENLLEIIRKNFEDSRFTYILISDRINDAIKDYLKLHNQKDDNSMYVVTLAYFKPKGTSEDIVISDVYGTETARKSQSKRNHEKWKEDGEAEFLKLVGLNPEITNEQKAQVIEFVNELKKILGGVPDSEDCEIGYYEWGEGSEPKFCVRLYEIGYHEKKDYSRLAFKIRSDGSIRFAITGYTSEIPKKFGEKFTNELRKIPCAKELVKNMDSGKKEPLWSPQEWIPCKKEFLEIIKKSEKYSSSHNI